MSDERDWDEEITVTTGDAYSAILEATTRAYMEGAEAMRRECLSIHLAEVEEVRAQTFSEAYELGNAEGSVAALARCIAAVAMAPQYGCTESAEPLFELREILAALREAL